MNSKPFAMLFDGCRLSRCIPNDFKVLFGCKKYPKF